jgi:hypothetical protein
MKTKQVIFTLMYLICLTCAFFTPLLVSFILVCVALIISTIALINTMNSLTAAKVNECMIQECPYRTKEKKHFNEVSSKK